MSDSHEKLFKVTLPSGEVLSVKAYFGQSSFEGALIDTDSVIGTYAEGETPANNWCDFRNNIGGETFNGLRARALEAQVKKTRMHNTFKSAVEELCVISHCDFDPADPMTTLQNLIQWNVSVALDPSVSESMANLHRQIHERNEFLARVILPILDDVPSANVDAKALDALQHYISESPGDSPFVYNSTWDAELEEVVNDEDPEMMDDIAVGRRIAEARAAEQKPKRNPMAPIWKRRRDAFKAEAEKLLYRRKALHIRREEMAAAIEETVKDIQRVENGLVYIGTPRIRKKIDLFLTKTEKEMA